MTREIRNYTLKLYDQELVQFTAQYDIFGEIEIKIKDFDPATVQLWPFGIYPDNLIESLDEWIKFRTVPVNRLFATAILGTAGLLANDKLGIIDICKGLSVNDAFWLDDGRDGLKFQDINLFDNELDETLAVIAYTGKSSVQEYKPGFSAEWTTNGQYPKAWRRINNQLVLFKAGTRGYANAGMEPYSEYFAAQLASAMGINHVPYDLAMWNGKLASTCPLLNSKDISYVPFAFASGNPHFPAAMAISRAFGNKMFEDYEDMTLFDALACNPDRHGANFGILRDNRTGMILDMAPIFDHNQALFPYLMSDEFDTMCEAANERYFPRLSELTFKEQVGMVMSKRSHKKLYELSDFSFQQHPEYPVPQERLDALNSYIKNRAAELLDLPVIDEEKRNALFDSIFAKMKKPIPMLDL